MYCHLRSNYREAGGFEILLNRFNPATFMCLSQGRTSMFNLIFRGLCMFRELRWEVIIRFVDISGIVDHYCLHFFFHKTFAKNRCFFSEHWGVLLTITYNCKNVNNGVGENPLPNPQQTVNIYILTSYMLDGIHLIF